jgi:hypothetical protein
MNRDADRVHLIDRREAVRRVSALLGGIGLVGETAFITGTRPSRPRAAARFSAQDIAFLDEVAETILPETKTPGAKAAHVGAFMVVMVADTYDEAEQRTFRDGMGRLDDACREMHGAPFLDATPAQRLALLQALDREQHAYMEARAAARGSQQAEPRPVHYFRMMKELTLLGYFTSEIGYTQAMRYVESPGRFDPCVPYAAGETIWAPHA